MENLTNNEMLLKPFAPVMVLRDLGPYGRILDLDKQVAKEPDPEFLVRLLTGHMSHQAYIRNGQEIHFKNLEHLIRGTHKPTPKTKRELGVAFGFLEEDLEKLDGSSPDGPLMPGLLYLFQVAEGLPMQVASGVMSIQAPCPCCGKSLLDDVDVWWTRNASGIGRNNYHFAERLLLFVVGAGLLERYAKKSMGIAELSLVDLDMLAQPNRHPIGNWLAEAQRFWGIKSLAALGAELQLLSEKQSSYSHGLLRKWSSGLNVMSLEDGSLIAKACDQTATLMPRLIVARTLALVTDFVSASLPGDALGRIPAQEIVYARLVQLGRNLTIAGAASSGKMPRKISKT